MDIPERAYSSIIEICQIILWLLLTLIPDVLDFARSRHVLAYLERNRSTRPSRYLHIPVHDRLLARRGTGTVSSVFSFIPVASQKRADHSASCTLPRSSPLFSVNRVWQLQ